MCGGGGGDQTITQKTELDPNLRRHLEGGFFEMPQRTAPAAPSAPAMTGGGSDNGGGDNFGGGGGFDPYGGGAPSQGGFDGPSPEHSGSGGMYAMGGMVQPQMGIASLNQGQMPMMNGSLPNLSDPMVAATLAAAALRPQTTYGMPMGFAMGGYVEGPGTGTSDSIDAVIMQNGQPVQEALLSDGEFVMTERAVRGAGNGDREQGAARMYEMMRQFERGGRV
jgi:hypothetical protein